jgi:formimidoylglutamate deiminase
MQHLAPDYIYTSQGLQAHMLVTISDDGRIDAIEALGEQAVHQSKIEALPGSVLLPGFVNTHSHVFQRSLRGHTHRVLSAQDNFWTWRRAMYAEARQLDPDRLYAVALHTYREMLMAGYTSVGEFHYVHHQQDGQPYANPNTMAEAVVSAGRDAGIHVVLLLTAYAQGGFDQPLEAGQVRFGDASVQEYLARVDALRVAGVPLGLAPHSVRAVPQEWFRAIAEYSRAHELPLHVHASEQVAEVEQCRVKYACGPIELLERFGVLGPYTTIIHATHASEDELSLLARHGCAVCVCPTTEGDLGDGIAPYASLMAKDILLAIGSDSNTRLDPIEELRWTEYSARMRYQRRRVLTCPTFASPGPLLLDIGTQGGAAALGLKTGLIARGMAADFVAVDLNHPAMRGWSEDDLLDVLFFGASSQVITQTWVRGKRVYAAG